MNRFWNSLKENQSKHDANCHRIIRNAMVLASSRPTKLVDQLIKLGISSRCSFGETVRLLHPFHEPFTDQSGARILQQFTFDQKKTKIAQVSASHFTIWSSSNYDGGSNGDGNENENLTQQ